MPDESRLSSVNAELQRALSHPKRREIFGYLTEKGDGAGATERELAAALGMGLRVIGYHLKVLQSAGQVARFDGRRPSGAERSFVAASSS